MKFIRDIISEKANQAGRTGREGPEADLVQDNPPDIVADAGLKEEFAAELANADVDVVHKVASGGQSLHGAPEYAFADEAPADPDSGFVSPEIADDGDLAPMHAMHDLTDQDGDDDDASELFGDLWPDSAVEQTSDDTDSFADETPELAEIETPAPVWPTDTSADDSARSAPLAAEDPAPIPVAPPARPTTRAIMPDLPPAQPAAAAPEESSPFQRMARRDRSLMSDVPSRQTMPASDRTDEAVTEVPADAPPETAAESPMAIKVPAPAAGRAARHAGRVKTRLLGFNTEQDNAPDPFATQPAQAPEATALYPVGWMVVTDGPGRGHAFALHDGVSQIGRGEGQSIRLDFGDNSISRISHAAIAYDGEQKTFFLGHGGKANLVRLNGNPVLSTERISNGATIRIGETTMRFVALCGNEFDWGSSQNDDIENAQFG